jgi:hypothetical protein
MSKIFLITSAFICVSVLSASAAQPRHHQKPVVLQAGDTAGVVIIRTDSSAFNSNWDQTHQQAQGPKRGRQLRKTGGLLPSFFCADSTRRTSHPKTCRPVQDAATGASRRARSGHPAKCPIRCFRSPFDPISAIGTQICCDAQRSSNGRVRSSG